jgi:DNA mismatch repair protein MutS2
MIDPFILNLPELDLHGFDRVSALIATEEFINDNIKLQNKRIIIIHGIGNGILKKEIHNYLKKNPKVLTYNLHWNNNGITIVNLK